MSIIGTLPPAVLGQGERWKHRELPGTSLACTGVGRRQRSSYLRGWERDEAAPVLSSAPVHAMSCVRALRLERAAPGAHREQG